MHWAAHTQQIPEPGTFSHTDLPTSEISTEAIDYDTARTQLDAQLPDGWRLLSVRQTT